MRVLLTGSSDFSAVLNALGDGSPLPFAHDPTYASPKVKAVA